MEDGRAEAEAEAEPCRVEGASQANKGQQPVIRLGNGKYKLSKIERPISIKEWEQEGGW